VEKEIISGWGNTSKASINRIVPNSIEEICSLLSEASPRSILPRGLGRSYGDASLLNNFEIIDLKNFNSIEIDQSSQTVNVGGGVSFDNLLKTIVPLGFFVPVTAGTKFITVGGAIAADIHGKNHHKSGSFGNFVEEILLVNGEGKLLTLTPDGKGEEEIKNFFWNTVGGMGLTGIIVKAKFRLLPIESSLISVFTQKFNSLELLMDSMKESDSKYSYSVSWVDSFDENHRGIMTCGEHTLFEDLPESKKNNPFSYESKSKPSAPSLLPSGLINKFTIKAFNEAWFRKSPRLKYDEIQSIENYFYPLDGISNWNRIYGSRGFLQYQFVVPDEAKEIVKYVLDSLKQNGIGSFLTVLKRFGKPNLAPLSFPISGWTLAIDLPNNNKRIYELLDIYDEKIQEAGGRIYLAKDSRQSSEIFWKSYKPEKWLEIKNLMDRRKVFCSDLSKRLKLT